MPGFGSGPFGSGPFGAFGWSRQVLYEDLPDIDRRLDQERAQGRLERFTDAIRPQFDGLMGLARRFGDLRDPDAVRTHHNERIDVVLLSASLDTDGLRVSVVVDDTDPADPMEPIGQTSSGWILRDSQRREFVVDAVHKIENTIQVIGNVLPVTEVSSPGNGAAILRPPSLVEKLGHDFGIEVDRYEPEQFQRSAVRNAVQWLDIKGVDRSYDVLGKISGYRVVPFALWRIPGPGFWEALPAASVFEAPPGDGAFYTELRPYMPCFDDVAADVEEPGVVPLGLDRFCWEDGLPSVQQIIDIEGPPDGTDVIPLLTSAVAMGGGRWLVTVAGDLINVASAGYWYLDAGSHPDVALWLETTPVETVPGSWDFEVLAGATAPSGLNAIRYRCPVAALCDYCAASVIRIEVTPAEVLAHPEALEDDALPRLVAKLLQVIPAHIRVVEISHVIGPVVAGMGPLALGIVASASVVRTLSAIAPFAYYYDDILADEIPTDPGHMVAFGSVFTIP